MSTVLTSKAEQLAKKAENYPSIFGGVNLTNIRENVNEILKVIGKNGIFREYTLHDANHIDAMLALVDKIIPEETQAGMKTADWLLIVLSCYLHDLGMLVTKQEFENRYDGTDFPIFKAALLADDKGKDYEEALERLNDKEREEFFYQEFVRENHAKRIFHWIQGQDARQYGSAESAVETINSLLSALETIVRDDLAKICLSHHENDLYDLDKYQINRVYGDDPEGEANIQYAAIILRAVDVLQIQKKRVPTVLYKLVDPSNPKSQEEWAKQAGVRAVKPKSVGEGSSDTIEVHASFEQESAYFGLLAYLQQYAGKELENCFEWSGLAQKKGATFVFPWRQIDSSQVEPRGFEGRSYSFRLDQEKILKLLTGHTLYNDSKVAIREVLQNALDAVRFRKHLHKDEEIGKIEVIWESASRKLTIRDTGTGMTQEVIEKFLLNVGSSYYQSDAVLRSDFSAISRFGIGVLSTFMIADEVQILTVHPDEVYARRLTLPSVVKSYLIKKLPKGDSAVRAIGQHGTEVTLQIRRSADVKDVESLVRYWLIIPGCKVTCKTDAYDPVPIGFSDVKEVLAYFYNREKVKTPWTVSHEVRTESAPGISLAYVVEKAVHSDVWDFARNKAIHPRDTSDEKLGQPPGMCVEGIRVRSEPCGYDTRDLAPWAFVNLTGPNAPKTNVARSDIEHNPDLDNVLFKIYSLLGNHIQKEFDRLLLKKTGIVEAAWEADYIRRIGLDLSRRSNPSKYADAMAGLKVIALEDASTCRAVSQQELDAFPELWTVDSSLTRNLEGVSGSLGIDLPTEKILQALGKSIEPSIPVPRILGRSVYPLEKRDITKIRIYPEERSNRVDICWGNAVPGRWIKVPNKLMKSPAAIQAFRNKSVWITRDPEVSADCSQCDLLKWRNTYLMLATSVVPELLDALGLDERFVRWLGRLLSTGGIPAEELPILKVQLAASIGANTEELLNKLALPFERRFGDYHGGERENS